jgi:lysophospholipase L1-like esterase
MKTRVFAAIAASLGMTGAIAGTAFPPPTLSSIQDLSGAVNRSRLKFVGRWWLLTPNPGTAGTDYSVTSRSKIVVAGPVSKLAALIGNSEPEGAGTQAPSINRLSFENASAIVRATVDGVEDFVVYPSGVAAGVLTDTIGFPVPPATTIYSRLFRRVPMLATAPSAAAIAGGNLANSSTYYYELTTVDNGIESGPSTEFSAATSSPNLAIRLSWTAPAYGQAINIYQGAASGAERFLAQVPIGQTSFADLGVLARNAAESPPAATATPLDRYLYAGESANAQYCGGAGTDQTGATGSIAGQTGPNVCYAPAPIAVLGDDYSHPSVLMLGDSIGAGMGIVQAASVYGQLYANLFDGAFADGAFAGTMNASIGGAHLYKLLNGAEKSWLRFRLLPYADDVLCQYGINDLADSQTWQQLAASQLTLAQMAKSAGARFYLFTLLPQTSSTDGWTTAANQTTRAAEAARLNYNAWVRAGALASAGTPVLSGGAPSSNVNGYFDADAVVEANAANVLTIGGGMWRAATSAAYSGQVLSGTPTTTSLAVSGAAYPVPSTSNAGLSGQRALMTSGAAAGQTAVIQTNTATSLTLYANGSTALTGSAMAGLTIAPAAGDTFSIIATPTIEGTHPSLTNHQAISAALRAWMAANLVPYGSMSGR